ncbi:uncharacterized protein LOC125239543 [Leguminivora glycinivorella]|uniref:uncharacterized protein LOC125239543 n=1 Tax=Leguminivora glycinivorella TaxID=1035111 RepID=UPI00200C38EA|nr:uncharacterized protein LOC125239543 [Leguminivora glycinivorella]
MESPALQGTESITEKAEPGEDACMTDLSTIAVSVKVEHFLDDVCVKDEPRPDGVCINSEPSYSEVSVKEESASARAAAELYAGHAVKDELVLGPELVERRGTRHATTVSNGAIKEQQSCEIVPRGPFLRDCSVRLNRLDMDKLLTHIRSTDRDNESASNGAIKEQQSCEIVPRGPFLRDCSVRLNRLDMDKLLTHIRSTDRDNESGQTPQKISSGGPDNYRCAHCHVARMPDDKWAKRLTIWKGPFGKRGSGRPRARWADDIEAVSSNWLTEAQDRERWKRLEEAYTRKGS